MKLDDKILEDNFFSLRESNAIRKKMHLKGIKVAVAKMGFNKYLVIVKKDKK